jgi:hypothetical protein
MPSNDSRQHYLRNTIAGFTTLTVPQSFLDNRPLLKTEATETEEATYYTEADGLTFFEAMKLYRPHSVGFYDESGDKPRLVTTLDQVDTPEDIPEDATNVFYGLHDWQPEEIGDAVRQADALGISLSQVLFPWGRAVQKYFENGI